MCGRLCCYCKHSSYSQRLSLKLTDRKAPEWQKPELFQPSCNLAPTCYVPVLHINKEKEMVIRPMKWGISTPAGHTVHNVRTETLAARKNYKWLFQDGGHCAILCDGFYEWKNKCPYFIYDAKTQFDASIISPQWDDNEWMKNGPPMMILAGVYSVSSIEDQETFTCSVITREANTLLSIHPRSPIALENDPQITTWLHAPADRNLEQSLAFLKLIKNENIGAYEVCQKVNKSSYQGKDCHHPLTSMPSQTDAQAGFLHRWMVGAKEGSTSNQNVMKKTTLNIKHTPAPDKREHSAKRKHSLNEKSPKKKALITDWFKNK